jgi:hypothetical protein
MIRGRVQTDQHKEERLLKNMIDQINQKSTSMMQLQANILSSIDEKTVQRMPILGSNQRTASLNNFEAHNFPGFITLSNSQLLMILEYINQKNFMGLTPKNGHRKDLLYRNFQENGTSGLDVIYDKNLGNKHIDTKNDDSLDLVKGNT